MVRFPQDTFSDVQIFVRQRTYNIMIVNIDYVPLINYNDNHLIHHSDKMIIHEMIFLKLEKIHFDLEDLQNKIKCDILCPI